MVDSYLQRLQDDPVSYIPPDTKAPTSAASGNDSALSLNEGTGEDTIVMSSKSDRSQLDEPVTNAP